MNFKRIAIRYRFLFQLLIFVIYTVLFSCIVVFVTNRMQDDRTMVQEIQKLQTQFVANHITYKNLLLSLKTDSKLFRAGENSFSEEFQNNLIHIKDSLDFLIKESNLGERTSRLAWYDSLVASINQYNTSFSQTILSLRELGDRNTGKLAFLYSNSEALTSALQGTGIPELSDASNRLKNLQFEYLTAPGRTKHSDIIYFLDEIIYLPAFSEADPLQTDGIRELIGSYISSVNDLQIVWNRLNSEGGDGLYSTMEKSLTGTNISFVQLISSLNSIQKIQARWFMLICIVIVVILSALYSIQFFVFYFSFTRPLKTSNEYCYNLSKGKLPDSELDQELPTEISILNENLNRISGSLKEKKLFVDSLLKQKFDIDMDLQGKNDTFGKTLIALKENMRKAREEQIKHAEENQIRRYQNEGIAKFSDILRNYSDDLNKLSDIFIKEIVRYLEAIQGGLFLLETDDETLGLKSAFAYNRKKYLKKTVKKGESLVGTCALEKKTILLSDIPEEYIEITSGLGDTPPKNLLLLPVMHEEKLIGVLEIASLSKFNSNQITLGEKIATSLASTIINARINSQTSELLQKSQQQAAEMAEQEEEMRQNMEELKATQEESARREEELEGILSAIDQSFYVLEYDIEGVITKVNQRFIYLVNLPLDKIIGCKHNQLFGKKSKADSLLFANVAEGNSVELNEKVEVNKKSLAIKNTFSPVRSKEGNTVKIINILTINT